MTKITKVSKRMLALFMAMLMMFSCVAVSASAAEETADFSKIEAVFDPDERTITVDYSEGVVLGENVHYNGVDVSCDGASRLPAGDNIVKFYNLEYGATYEVKCSVNIGGELYSETILTQKVNDRMNAPEKVIPIEITSGSITISAAKDAEYIILDKDGKNIGYDWDDSNGSTAIMFDNLSADTYYTIKAKRPAMEGFYESETITLSVKTNKAAITEVPEIKVQDKSNKSIVVVAVDPIEGLGVEFSMDGKTWQESPEFNGLNADTQYNVYARYSFAEDQDPSKASEALVVRTNAKANFEADEKKITFTVNDNKYASSVKFTVKGDGPANMNEVVYGDTRIIPVSFKVVKGNDTVQGKTDFNGEKVSQTGTFTADAYAEQTVEVVVTYSVDEYKGVKKVDGKDVPNWVSQKTIETKTSVKLGRVDDPTTKIKEFFESILNFLLNTVPKFITEAMKSDIWDRIIKLLGDLGKVVG